MVLARISVVLLWLGWWRLIRGITINSATANVAAVTQMPITILRNHLRFGNSLMFIQRALTANQQIQFHSSIQFALPGARR